MANLLKQVCIHLLSDWALSSAYTIICFRKESLSEILFSDFESRCPLDLTVRAFHLVLVSWAASDHSVHVLSGQEEFGLLLSDTPALPLDTTSSRCLGAKGETKRAVI